MLVWLLLALCATSTAVPLLLTTPNPSFELPIVSSGKLAVHACMQCTP